MKEALLIIDLQKGVCKGASPLYQVDILIERVNQRIAEYRQKNLPIIFIQHEDEELVKESESWRLHPDLQALATDHFVGKTHANSFYHTRLQEVLQQENVDALEIWGAQTQYCVDATVKFAHGLGYQLFMEKGGSTTADNSFMSAEQTIAFYEDIWRNRFATLK